MTGETFHPIPELSLEVIHDEAIVAHLVDRPFLLACDLLRKLLKFSLTFWCGMIISGFDEYTINILVKAIQKEGQKFLRIMLVGSAELGGVITDRSSKIKRVDMRKLRMRHFVKNAGERVGQPTLRAQTIAHVDSGLPPPICEKSSKWYRGTQTLDRCIHVASIAQILQSSGGDLRVGPIINWVITGNDRWLWFCCMRQCR